jgi:transcription initiation factor TFIID subunit 8
MGSGWWCGPRLARAPEAAKFDCAHRMVVDVLLSYITHIGRSTAFNTNLVGHALTNELDIIRAASSRLRVLGGGA